MFPLPQHFVNRADARKVECAKLPKSQISNLHGAMLALRSILILLLVCAAMPWHSTAAEPLTDVQKIRALSREEASKALPVKLNGVVLYTGRQELVIHDGRSSIFLDLRIAAKRKIWQGDIKLDAFQPGSAVEVEGFTDPGPFSPIVLVQKLTHLGQKPIPEPGRLTIEKLLSSSPNTRWVEVEGVVRKVEKLSKEQVCVTLIIGGHLWPVLLPCGELSPAKYVDARVRVRGVLINIANFGSQISRMKLHCSSEQDIETIVPPPSDPFRALHVPLSRLVTYQPDAVFDHRRSSKGLVTFARPGKFFYLMDQQTSVRVDCADARVSPGDFVEISGFIDTKRNSASFSEAVVRKIGTGTPPPPSRASISTILPSKNGSQAGISAPPAQHDGRVILLRGLLRRVLPSENEGSTIVIEAEGHLVQAYLPDPAPHWIEGSTIELVGLCELKTERLNTLPWFAVNGFHVWLDSSRAVTIISTPPWWTAKRLGVLLAVVFFILALTFSWGYTMRRKVAVRGNQLAAEIAAHESAKLEFDTVLRERRRLANDLHDNLEQSLTGLAMQLEIVSRSKTTDPARSERHLKLAQQFLERSRNEAHRTVWDLRAHGQDGKDFLEILGERVSAMVVGSGIKVTFKREGDPIPLPDLIAGNLLLLAQEAVTNALKHADASAITILLRMSPPTAELIVADDGDGFDPATAPSHREGHFGIDGMRQRAKRLGGKMEITSSPRHGTTIRATIPLETV